VSTESFTAAQDAAVIRARGVAKRFKTAGGEVRALNGVDVDVRRGQMLVLLGPSGCGKTTLLRCIGGLEDPNEGTIELGGRTVTSIERRINVLPERRNLGMMFQSYGLWPHMTVVKNVAYPLENQSRIASAEIPGRVAAMLETMGLSNVGDRYPGQLSGGQQQRVALARALVGSPTALLFDEPLSNVDAQVRKRLREEIRQMKDERGFAGVYVTHDQEEAMALADVLAVMQDGEIRQIGSPLEIYRSPRSLYVARFVGEANTVEAIVAYADRENVVAETALGRLVVAANGGRPQVGAKGHVVVRPEDISIVSGEGAAVAGSNRIPGRIISSVLLGPHVELIIEFAGTKLRVWASSARAHEFAVGAITGLELPVGRLVWISE
jgi:iron(III) transport system ATP-binding protein